MAKEQNTIFHRWFEEVRNNDRTEVIDEMIARNAIAHGLEDLNDQTAMRSAAGKIQEIPSQLSQRISGYSHQRRRDGNGM